MIELRQHIMKDSVFWVWAGQEYLSTLIKLMAVDGSGKVELWTLEEMVSILHGWLGDINHGLSDVDEAR